MFFLFYAASRKEANIQGTKRITKATLKGSLCVPLCPLWLRLLVVTPNCAGPQKPSLISPGEGQGGHIVVLGSRVHEVLHALQDALRKILGG